jgi:hypothetical protein
MMRKKPVPQWAFLKEGSAGKSFLNKIIIILIVIVIIIIVIIKQNMVPLSNCKFQ